MKPLREYIKTAFISFMLLLLFVELLNFLFGSKSRTLGNSYGPQSVEEIINNHLIKDSVVLAISITIIKVLVFLNDKYQFQKKQKQKKSPIKDPILNKIIEDAKSGKTADDILKAQNEDSKIENEENDDHK